MPAPNWITNDNQQFLTAKDAANYVHVHVKTMYSLLRKGPPAGPPARKINARNWQRGIGWQGLRPTWRIPKAEFIEWAHQMSVKGAE